MALNAYLMWQYLNSVLEIGFIQIDIVLKIIFLTQINLNQTFKMNMLV